MPLPVRRTAAALLAAMCLALAGCLLTPGKFTSTLDIRKDGAFTFAYTGEIHMLALSKLAEMGDKPGDAATFTPDPCTGPAPDGKAPASATKDDDTRPCTDAEIAKQREDWQAAQNAMAASKQKEAQQRSAMLGGIDPTSPKAAEEFATRLRHQAGWRRVDYKGDGVFDVDFAMTGRLTHDFAFPTLEKMPYAIPFVSVFRHADGTLRIDAPAFVGGGSNSAAMLAQMGNSAGRDSTSHMLDWIDGQFTLTTDAAILANNTDDGPARDARGQALHWTVNARTSAAPTALLRLAN